MNFDEEEIIRKAGDMVSEQKKRWSRIRMDLLCISLVAVIGVLVMLGYSAVETLQGIFDSAPRVGQEELLNSTYATVIYDNKGREIQEVTGRKQKQSYVTLDQISPAVQNAFVASVDPRFYSHYGVDIRGLLMSLSDGGSDLGASYRESGWTLTRHLLRNQIFQYKNDDTIYDSITRELQEQYLAVRLEKEYGKDKILEYYLNTLHFGHGLTGVQTAAKFYFNKGASDITVSEAALLAAVAQDSASYDPLEHQAENRKQRGVILESMLSIGSITEEEYEDALGDDVYMKLQGAVDKSRGMSEAKDYYVDAALKQVIQDLKDRAGYSYTQAYQAVCNGGLHIYTCQDQEMQNVCEREIKAGMNSADPEADASFVLIDQRDGRVKALVGGRRPHRVDRDNNRATDQTSSAGNVLSLLAVWLPALDTAGMTLGSVEDDSSYTYQVNGIDKMVPQTSDHKGLVTMRDSIMQGLDIPAVKTMEKTDVQTGYDYLRRLGISTLVAKRENEDGTVASDIDLSMASGTMVDGVTNLELTAAYAAVANAGAYHTPVFYSKVLDRDGNVLLENEQEEKKRIKSSSAWLLTDVLRNFVAQGDGQKAAVTVEGVETAGMSGRDQTGNQIWFEGYTPYYTAGIWCGTRNSYGWNGKMDVQMVWSRIMNQVHDKDSLEEREFTMPRNITECNICTKCGKLAVEGLCNKALGGSAVRKEYFAHGTEPLQKCDCHVRYYVCKVSEKLAVEACPKEKISERVYLKKGDDTYTDDSRYILTQEMAGSRCDVHGKSEEE